MNREQGSDVFAPVLCKIKNLIDWHLLLLDFITKLMDLFISRA